MKTLFEWDERKAKENLRKHKVSFAEAATVFSDPLSVTIPDPEHSIGEQRYIDLGTSDRNHVLVVVYTERAKAIRLISARKATRTERKQYEKENS
jgi:uncharacterized protein